MNFWLQKKKKQHALCKNIMSVILSRCVNIHVNQLHAVLSAAGSAHAQLFFLSCINSLIKFGWEGGPLWKGKWTVHEQDLPLPVGYTSQVAPLAVQKSSHLPLLGTFARPVIPAETPRREMAAWGFAGMNLCSSRSLLRWSETVSITRNTAARGSIGTCTVAAVLIQRCCFVIFFFVFMGVLSGLSTLRFCLESVWLAAVFIAALLTVVQQHQVCTWLSRREICWFFSSNVGISTVDAIFVQAAIVHVAHVSPNLP